MQDGKESLEDFGALAQPFDHRQVLGTSAFALAAVDAVRSLAPALNGPAVGLSGLLGLIAGQLFVGSGENLGNENLPRAALHAVAAAGAGNGRRMGQNLLGPGNGVPLILVHRTKLGEGGQVVLHLGQVGHAGQHRHALSQSGCKPQRPGGAGPAGRTFSNSALTSWGGSASAPPFTGSMMTICLPWARAIR